MSHVTAGTTRRAVILALTALATVATPAAAVAAPIRSGAPAEAAAAPTAASQAGERHVSVSGHVLSVGHLPGRVAPSARGATGVRSTTARSAAGGPVVRASRAPLAGVTVVVDPGHSGATARDAKALGRLVYAGNGIWKPCNTTGTQTRSGYPEHAQTWDTATRLAALLRAQGARVVLTRPDDHHVGPCIDQRAAIGNRAHATLVVSIHADGNLARGARGFHVITSTRMAGGAAVQQRSTRLALAVRDAYAAGTGMPRSTYLGHGTALTPRGDIGGLNLSRVPAVMIETGNMRDATDARLLASPAFRQREAAALVTGIRRYLGR